MPPRPSSHPRPDRPLDETNPMLYVACEFCGDKVRRGRLEEHERRVHPWRREALDGSISFDDCRDEGSLRRKLKQALGAWISVERKAGWGLPSVPTLRSDGVWSDEHQDIYWRAFTSFCRWPSPKACARLEVRDSGPAAHQQDTKRLVLFYREDLQRLSVSVRVGAYPTAQSNIVEQMTLHQLCRIQELQEALLMQRSSNGQSRSRGLS